MSGIVYQFSNSPINKSIRRLTISASGTVSPLLTGSSHLMWRARTNAGNTGEVRIMTKHTGTDYWTLEAGDDTGWIPGNLQNYWYYGVAANDELSLWSME